MAYTIEPFDLLFVENCLTPPLLERSRDSLGDQPGAFEPLDHCSAEELEFIHMRMERRWPGSRCVGLRRSDAPGFYEQEDDPADERECSDDWRDKVAIRGLNMHAEEFDRLSRGCESDARVSEHDQA